MTPTNHPLTETAAAELWDASRDPRRLLADRHEELHHDERATAVAAMRAAFDAGRDYERESTPLADPHHDPRPWQDCTREDIRKGDLVETRIGDSLCVGVAHRQDENGDWRTKDGRLLTYGDHWPLRRIPAPTPPAEEVELPTEHPAHITDVEGWSGDVCAYMALDRDGFWTGVGGGGSACAWEGDDIAAFTLPDGTRARRDGECEDGTPRFVKVQEEDA